MLSPSVLADRLLYVRHSFGGQVGQAQAAQESRHAQTTILSMHICGPAATLCIMSKDCCELTYQERAAGHRGDQAWCGVRHADDATTRSRAARNVAARSAAVAED